MVYLLMPDDESQTEDRTMPIRRPSPRALTLAITLSLLTLLTVSNVALLHQNRDLTTALERKLPDEFVEKTLENIPGVETNLAEAIQQWTVNEQHLHLLDDIQSQQLKLIQGLTNRVNQSAALIRQLEEQQGLLDERALNIQRTTEQRARTMAPETADTQPDEVVAIEIVSDTDPEEASREDEEETEDQTDIDIVLEEAFSGVQVDTLTSIDNPAFSGVVVWDYDNQTGLVQLSNLPSLPPDFVYQLWVLDPSYDAFIDAGAFLLPDSNVPFEYTFRPGLEIIQALGFAISAESTPVSGIPTGPTVVATPNLLN